MTGLVVFSVVCLAFANGANDNFKGVATLFGSGTTRYAGALAFATVCTFAGSLCALVLAETLLQRFTGKGLVDLTLVDQLDYRAAVGLGAGFTVLLATRLGLPISTTHSLVGALMGAAVAAGSAVNHATLGKSFFLPMLTSPLIAIAAAALMYPLFRLVRRKLNVTEASCFCIGKEVIEVAPAMAYAVAVQRAQQMSAEVGDRVSCARRYQGNVLGIDAEHILNGFHYLSAGLVSFARGLNDTPKIAAIVFVAPLFTAPTALALVGVAIAIGGWVAARRVAETMSNKITTMNHGQGFTANLVTGLVVIGASRLGLPVSTTHVSCGALFGLGAATGQGHWPTILKVVGSWIVTLPLGFAAGGLSLMLIRAVAT